MPIKKTENRTIDFQEIVKNIVLLGFNIAEILQSKVIAI